MVQKSKETLAARIAGLSAGRRVYRKARSMSKKIITYTVVLEAAIGKLKDRADVLEMEIT
jgi:hypothetical protein